MPEENLGLEEFSDQGAPSTEPDHFDQLISDAEKVESQQQIDAATSHGNALTQDQFIEFYADAFTGAAHLTRLKSLAIDVSDDQARRGLVGLYKTCCRYPWMNWALKPGGEQMMDLFAVMTLFGGMATGVAAEIKERKQSSEAPAPSEPTQSGEDPMAAFEKDRMKAAHEG